MAEKMFMRVAEVAEEMDVSIPYAYKVIRKMNAELKKTGSIGNISGSSFMEQKRKQRGGSKMPVYKAENGTWYSMCRSWTGRETANRNVREDLQPNARRRSGNESSCSRSRPTLT